MRKIAIPVFFFLALLSMDVSVLIMEKFSAGAVRPCLKIRTLDIKGRDFKVLKNLIAAYFHFCLYRALGSQVSAW